MSEKEKIEFREKLDKALKESFFKMIDLKKKLGQTVIISDKNGKPMEVSAEEVERLTRECLQDVRPESHHKDIF